MVQTSEQGIIGGAPAGADDPAVYGLVLFMNGGQGICTSTLIGSKTLLTAAHCVENVTAVEATNVANMHTAQQSSFIEAVDWRIHPSWNSDPSAGFDIALVELKTPVATVPKQWNQTSLTGFAGKPVRLVGYGVRDDRQSDGEKYEVAQKFAEIFSNRVRFDQSNGKGGCFGDSGGPAFHTFPDGVERVAGITSYGEDQCQFSSYYTRVDIYTNFILQWLAEKETPTCARDGMCKQGCTTPDIDCLCPVDGTCNATCPNVADDPDCDARCIEDDFCATGACLASAPDPDCKAAGEMCDSKNECPGRECKTDPQSDDYYCSAKCDTTTPCPTGLECTKVGKDSFCLKKQLPEADLGDACTKGKTYCESGSVCAGSPSKCVPKCEADKDCGLDLVCSGKDGAVKYCQPKATQQTTTPGGTTPKGTVTPTTDEPKPSGCAQTDASAAWLVLAAMTLVLRRRRR